MSPSDLIDDLRSRINPAYANQIGTESYERRLCAEALEALIAELDDTRTALSAAIEHAETNSRIMEARVDSVEKERDGYKNTIRIVRESLNLPSESQNGGIDLVEKVARIQTYFSESPDLFEAMGDT